MAGLSGYYITLTFHSHNPVGKVYSKDELQRIGDLAVKHNLIILSDEVSIIE